MNAVSRGVKRRVSLAHLLMLIQTSAETSFILSITRFCPSVMSSSPSPDEDISSCGNFSPDCVSVVLSTPQQRWDFVHSLVEMVSSSASSLTLVSCSRSASSTTSSSSSSSSSSPPEGDRFSCRKSKSVFVSVALRTSQQRWDFVHSLTFCP